jgi:hypothetical protein
MYYFADDVKSYFPEIFYNTGRDGVYGIISNGKIEKNEYIHAYFINGKWSVSTEKHLFSKLLVTTAWLDSVLMQNDITVSRRLCYIEPKEIILDENEKFTLVDGGVYNITVVGNINKEHIYFNMHDIININDDMITYYESITYNKTERRTRLFYRRIKPNEPLTISYYFTYYGIIAFLSKGRAIPLLKRRLRNWIDSVLLTEDTDVDSQLFKRTCDSLNSSGAVYLLKLGLVRDLRHKFRISNDNIHDESIVYKHGKTYDIKNEFIFHYNYYKRYWHCDAKLVIYDELHQYDTESLLNYFRKQGIVINCGENILGNTEFMACNPSQIMKNYNIYSNDLSHLHEKSGDEKQEKEAKQEDEKNQEKEINRKIKRDKKIDRRRERAIEKERDEEHIEEEKHVEDEEEHVEEEKHVDNIIQKTIVENNETEDNSVFKCIIDWFENSFTSFCW